MEESAQGDTQAGGKMSVHTLRGLLDANEARRLIVDDGRYKNGLIVSDFRVFGTNHNQVIDGVTLSYTEIAHPTLDMDAGNSNQFGWAGAGTGHHWQVLDVGHVAVQDIWIRNLDQNQPVNYVITLLPVELTDAEGVMALIKERIQDDLP